MGLNRYLYYYSLGKIDLSWQRAIKVLWLERGQGHDIRRQTRYASVADIEG